MEKLDKDDTELHAGCLQALAALPRLVKCVSVQQARQLALLAGPCMPAQRRWPGSSSLPRLLCPWPRAAAGPRPALPRLLASASAHL